MMAELKRKEEQLTTADLARGSEAVSDVKPVENQPDRPKPVRAESETFRQKGPEAVATDVRTHSAAPAGPTPLFSESDVRELRAGWGNVQTSFVDEPRRAVEQADQLVASVMKRLAEGFANERATLEKQWDRGDQVSTEDLRVALQRYRSFFDRLLNA